MKEYVKINNDSIEFKNLISGPAQVGRILNYIIYAGEGTLKHKPGNRNDTFENNIGSAWCIEFMIGLGLIELDSKINDSNVYYTKLTSQGIKIYNILIENALGPIFEHDSNVKNTIQILKDNNALNIINVFEEVFRKSIIFKDLLIFLNVDESENRIIEYSRNEFMEDLFGELCEFYTGQIYVRNGNGATTAGNRVPSLIQLLEFLNYVEIRNKIMYFNSEALKEGIFDDNYKLDISDNHFIKEYEKEEKIIEKLANEFGIQGNHIVTETVRLSQTQLIFKERLKREHGSKCWLCGIENDILLIASHIKDASKCDIYDKTNNNNGLLLCAQHDKLFDSGLISFNFMTGNIMISNYLSEHDKKLTMLSDDMKLDNELLTQERRNFLIWHNNNFMSNEND